jgi:hypothetical protein
MNKWKRRIAEGLFAFTFAVLTLLVAVSPDAQA